MNTTETLTLDQIFQMQPRMQRVKAPAAKAQLVDEYLPDNNTGLIRQGSHEWRLYKYNNSYFLEKFTHNPFITVNTIYYKLIFKK